MKRICRFIAIFLTLCFGGALPAYSAAVCTDDQIDVNGTCHDKCNNGTISEGYIDDGGVCRAQNCHWGTYMNSELLCEQCPPGNWCWTGITTCPAGYFCPAGIYDPTSYSDDRYKCPPVPGESNAFYMPAVTSAEGSDDITDCYVYSTNGITYERWENNSGMWRSVTPCYWDGSDYKNCDKEYIQCPLGHHLSTDSAGDGYIGSCQACQIGYANGSVRIAAGELTVDGTSMPARTVATTCGECWGIYYSEAPGMSDCTPCPTTPQNGNAGATGYQAKPDGIHDSPYGCYTGVPWDTVQQPGTAHGTGMTVCYYVDGSDGNAQYGSIVGNGGTHQGAGVMSPGTGTCDSSAATTCDPGYYFKGSVWESSCIPVAAGYYSPADDITRSECVNAPTDSHYTDVTAATANCAWTCDDGHLLTLGGLCKAICQYPGLRTLRIGNYALPLFFEKNTEHVVAVQHDGNVCYANMVSGSGPGLNIDIAGAVWHTTE